ncbi:MAG: DUF1292 domain-containing protein [Oscillospiraceae bacterium]|nr:DUF1292 domain-containing protein [Oscillospiraceae bacterium]
MDDNKNLTPEELEEQPEILILTDEDGNEEAYEYLTIIPYEGEEYIILMPVGGEEDGEVVILRIEPIPGNDEEENYVDVEDDAILEAVFNLFKEWYADEYDFE